jgi:hypothetical protein
MTRGGGGRHKSPHDKRGYADHDDSMLINHSIPFHAQVSQPEPEPEPESHRGWSNPAPAPTPVKAEIKPEVRTPAPAPAPVHAHTPWRDETKPAMLATPDPNKPMRVSEHGSQASSKAAHDFDSLARRSLITPPQSRPHVLTHTHNHMHEDTDRWLVL